jgi:hypothetical protein
MIILAAKTTLAPFPGANHAELCPYRDASMNICAASLTAMRVAPSQISCYCSTDNFSDCAIFLSKALRSK